MVENRWRDDEAQRLVDAAGADPADQALALRVYTSRLIGGDPDLVMHGATGCRAIPGLFLTDNAAATEEGLQCLM